MALEEYVGSIIMEIDGKEVDIASVDPTVATGRRVVKTMNRTGRPKGFAKGMADYSLRVTAPVPLNGEEIDWEAVAGAKITIFPLEDGGQRVSYLDCVTESVGESYKVDGESMRDIQMFALRKVNE